MIDTLDLIAKVTEDIHPDFKEILVDIHRDISLMINGADEDDKLNIHTMIIINLLSSEMARSLAVYDKELMRTLLHTITDTIMEYYPDFHRAYLTISGKNENNY